MLKERVIYYPTPAHSAQGNADAEGQVDIESTRVFIKTLELMASYHKPGSDLRIIMNCEGGDQYQGMAVYDAIRRSPLCVTIEGRGVIMSMGVYILQAAKNGHRILSPSSRLMIHEGSGGVGDDHPSNVTSNTRELALLTKLYTDVIWSRVREKHPSYSRKRFANKMKFDWFLSAQEAVDLGVADKIE